MARAKKKPKQASNVVASNRKARHDFEIGETYECGIVLQGSEVKSLRESSVTIAESFCRVHRGELWLYGLFIGAYSHAGSAYVHKPDRVRKLLVHRYQIEQMQRAVDHDGRTLVPLKLYFKDGRAKLEIAVARRRRSEDKRQALREKQAGIEARREMGAVRR